MICIKRVGARAHGSSSAMDSRWFAVLAVCAAIAGAAARPGVASDIDDPTKSLNEVNSKDLAMPKPDDTAADVHGLNAKPITEVSSANDISSKDVTPKPDVKPEEGKTNDVEVVAVQATTEVDPKADKSDRTSNDAMRAINERYPHAVLFGGTCGGTIISPNWILTAGHCSLGSGGRYVLAGTGDMDDDEGVIRYVKRLIIHPLFSVGPYWLDADQFGFKQVAARWDFLLAELEEPLPLNGKTMVAATINEQPTIPEGLEAGYGGYGAKYHGDTMRTLMHSMELQVLEDSKCKEALVQYDNQDMMCTKGRPPRFDSACNGDSGSGLVANNTLYGVASWVQDDALRCFNGALVVFSRVSAVRDWIKQVTGI